MERELFTAGLTALFTVVIGVIVFVSQQIIEKFYITPFSEYRRTLADISYNLIYYANVYTNPGTGDHDTQVKVSEKLRESASKLISTCHMINGYWILRLFRLIPSRKQINEAANLITMLSNSTFRGDVQQIMDWNKRVSKILNLHIFGN